MMVERKLYDSQLNNKLDADYDAGFGASFLSMMNGFGPSMCIIGE